MIGDIILDAYLRGDSTRLSPEAPVPVVNVSSRDEVVGGAANIAVNLRALGADVTFVSVLGEDEYAERSIDLLQKAGVDTTAIVKERGRRTMVKTRVIVHNQILARFDYGTQKSIGSDSEAKLIQFLEEYYED